MNDVDGMKILQLARQRLPDCEVVMVTGHATVPIAVEAMQQGAFNFLEKPITPNRLRAIAAKAAEAVSLKRQNTELLQRLDERFGFEGHHLHQQEDAGGHRSTATNCRDRCDCVDHR